MNKLYFLFVAADCKVRWINIRDVYRRILKKNILAGRTLRKYKYEEDLSFMKPFYRDVVISHDLQEKDDEDWNESQDNVEQSAENDNDPSYQSEDSDVTQKVAKPKKRRKAKKKREKFLEVEVDEEKPSTSLENANHELDPSDAVDAFLLSIGATLKTFSPYHLNLAKSKIFAIVQEHDLQQIVQKETSDDTKISTSETMFLHE